MWVVGDDDAQARLQHPLDLDPGEGTGPLIVELVCEDLSFLMDVITERGASVHVADEDEVPGLAEPDAGRGVRGAEDPVQHVGGCRHSLRTSLSSLPHFCTKTAPALLCRR